MDSDGVCASIASFLCFVERNGRERLLVSQLIQVTPTDSWWFGRSLAISDGSCHHCSFMFAILTLLKWTTVILTNRDRNCLKNYFETDLYPLLLFTTIFSPTFCWGQHTMRGTAHSWQGWRHLKSLRQSQRLFKENNLLEFKRETLVEANCKS